MSTLSKPTPASIPAVKPLAQESTSITDPGPTLIDVMPKVVTIDPVTRVEGHLAIRVQLDRVDGELQVVDAWSTGTQFRGLESILVNRHPWDAVPITQRICGVCPVSHGLAATLAIEQATGISAPTAGRILRNLVLGSNYLQSHILHFYHLCLPDFWTGPDKAPWRPNWQSDQRLNSAQNDLLTQHYVLALAMRRKAHEMGAVFGGKLPHPASYVPGGITCTSNAMRKTRFQSYLTELTAFIQNTWLPDIELLGQVYDDSWEIGGGTGNLLAYGVFDLDATGSTKLLSRGRVVAASTTVLPVDIAAIAEDVTYSWYADSTNHLPPASGQTVPQLPKGDAYSWLKAPRYANAPYECGPLARMWVNGDYREGISLMDRHYARALEALKVAQAMQDWLNQVVNGGAAYTSNAPPAAGTGVGLTEAARGALGHWLQIAAGKISRYQVITPTCWNASPRDQGGIRGPIEEALIGTPVLDASQPVEVLRVVHSYDPCMSCAVHVMRADEKAEVVYAV